ncbi:MAG: hypothetical protein ACTIJJ_05640 [Galactobacter sp.]
MCAESSFSTRLVLGDSTDVRDLDVFLARSVRVRDGVARLVVRGSALAVHVAAAFPLILGSGGPTIVGQRGARLAEPGVLDVVVPVGEVRDRLARMQRTDSTVFDVPPSRPSAPWTATLPLSVAWQERGLASDDVWLAAARDVATAVSDSLPTDPGQAMVFQARDALWGQSAPDLGEGAVLGAAFLADAYGFLSTGGRSRRFTSGTWERLSSRGGTLLWRAG